MPAARTSPRLVLTVLAVSTGSFAMLQSLLAPVLSTLQSELRTDAASVTWVLTAWLLSAAVATPLLGRVGDMLGKERTLLVALSAVALGSLIAAVAPSLPLVLVGRVVQGLGGAAFPLSFGILRDEFAAHRVPSAVGFLSAVIAAGGGVGMVLAGPIETAFGWRALFWIPMVVVLVALALAWRFVPESPVRTPGRVNALAAVLLAGWLVALLVPLSQANAWGWGSARTLGLLAVAAVGLAAWVAVEVRSATPLIDMRMMRLPAVWTTNLVALLFGAQMFGIYAFVPQFVELPTSTGYGFGESVTVAGLLMVPMLVTMSVTGVLSGRIAAVLAYKPQLVLASLVSALGSASLAVLHAAPWQLAVAGGVLGVGFGLAYSALTSLIVQAVPAAQTGAASGMNVNIRTIGGALGTAVVSSLVTASAGADGLPAERGFTTAFLVLAGASVVAAGLALLVPTTRRPLAVPEPVAVPAPVPAAAH
ncbi:Major facilitator superfamily MFS_1 [Modestobacter italicus]|uniref:Major facilitator superfamily MFS_1 n=1 Tax=Modestobacter italicus (strain DSM 44449 / CECT 9708 / BC 501) TaxID=2732864 RepID=I4F1W7_MODI5|nr:MFS transporter [Modestobacter marinus]CCH89630.1 Major facilitator superfamily MFS_1 [Modestobacter marinus]